MDRDAVERGIYVMNRMTEARAMADRIVAEPNPMLRKLMITLMHEFFAVEMKFI